MVVMETSRGVQPNIDKANTSNSSLSKYLPFQVSSPEEWGGLLPDWALTRLAQFRLPAPLTLLIIGLALVVAVMAPRIAVNQRIYWMFLGAFFSVVGAVILLRWPTFGWVGLIIVALFVPFSIGTGSQTGINGAVILLTGMFVIWLLEMFSSKQQIRLLANPAVTAAVLMCVVAIVAFGFGQFFWLPTRAAPLRAQIGGLAIFILSMIGLLVVAHQIKSYKQLEWMVWVIIAAGAVFVAMRLLPVLRPYIFRVFVRQAALGVVFYIWFIAFAAAQALFNPKLDRRLRLALGVLVLLFFYVNTDEGRFWISGWLPALIAMLVVVVLGKPELGIWVFLLGVIGLVINFTSDSGVLSEGDNSYSMLTRFEAWRIMWEIIKINPVFGLGMANYYWYTPLFSILGYNVNFNSHNNYIDIVAQTGLVGLLCFLWLMWEVWRTGWRTLPRAPEGFPRAYVIGAMGGLIGTLAAAGLGDWVIPFVYNIGLIGFRSSIFAWLFMGGLLAVANMIGRSNTDTNGVPAV
jgi:hypothetical protein